MTRWLLAVSACCLMACGSGAARRAEWIEPSTGMVFVLVPAGEFTMGSPLSEADREPSEVQHDVALSRPFFMGKYEVTQEQWQKAGTRTAFATGATLTPEQADFDARGRAPDGPHVFRGRTVPVGSFQPNRWGLFDMSGNVWEWCEDDYCEYPAGRAVHPPA